MEIFEVDRNLSVPILEAKQADGTVAFKAPALSLIEFTKNGRRYPKKVVEAALGRITQADGKTMYGTLGHKEKPEILDVSHLIDRLWIDEKSENLMVQGRILPNEKGKDLLAIVNAGGKVGLSVKGSGSVKSLGEGKSEVSDDYRLIGVDFTLSPASSVATVNKGNLFESLDFEEISSHEELKAKINEAVKAGLKKVDSKIRPLVEIELKKQELEAVELVEETIKDIVEKIRFILVEAERSKIVMMVEDKPELGHVKSADIITAEEKRAKAIVQEARAAGSNLSEEEILRPRKK
ncbi:MAG: hypothetical protein MIO92_12845 [Methanosarcinaceae archaeon]|nr:hypothetical protein [Methanosarcinaceae archaeon]